GPRLKVSGLSLVGTSGPAAFLGSRAPAPQLESRVFSYTSSDLLCICKGKTEKLTT
uniref:Uncharacterized protein n=1 Tax=Saimiri boliviensis boliviensis TaxID=39432 RepID=A0A2K6V341_SAIBB